jgi:hypothetical protein
MARRLFSRACRCNACRRRDSGECAAIIAANYSPRALLELERESSAAVCDELETMYSAPAISPGARIVCRLAPEEN